MNEELDKQLVNKYPKIFANRYGDKTETAMCWGLEHGDGWFNIIDRLCANIQGYIDWQNQVNETVQQVVADQVKEKYGTLRFYYSGGDDRIAGMVTMAESMSAVTCEFCGKPGKRNNSGWLRTACEEHQE